MADEPVAHLPIVRFEGGASRAADDRVAVEAPLEIRIDGRPLAVTLRTPGDDRALALGFLAGEGLIRAAADVLRVAATPAACADEPDGIDLMLAPHVRVDWSRLERHFAASSACGLCGRAHLESLRQGLAPVETGGPWAAEALMALPARMREAQAAFAETGGIHAAAYLGADLRPVILREDVGRHNAVDKVIGGLLQAGTPTAGEGILWVSGRAGAEIVIKAARAGLPLLAAVGAPTSLAVTLAETAGMTLIGFLKADRLNAYCGARRIVGADRTRK